MWRGVSLFAFIALSFWTDSSLAAKKYNITIGYLPCLLGELKERQGLTISGAISIALEELNNSTELLPDVDLLLEWHDTKCDTITATRLITDMSYNGVVAFFGPEGYCRTESIVAQSRNLPMISYKCFDQTSPSTLSNFVSLEPSSVQVSKSVISLLRYYRWNKFSIFYEESWEGVALALENHAIKNNMTLNHKKVVTDAFTCCMRNLTCCRPRYWYDLIRETKSKTRIYVYLGTISSLIDMMTAMKSHRLFTRGEYMVIFVDKMASSPRKAVEYFIKIEDRTSTNLILPNAELKKRAQSLFVVALSEPSSDYEEFCKLVRKYNKQAPFHIPDIFAGRFNKIISIYAAYLYDSVKIYAKALDDIIREETQMGQLDKAKLKNIATNGSRIVEKIIKNSPYQSISGMPIHLDEHAESEGSFELLACKPAHSDAGDLNLTYNMVPVGHFQQSNGEYPTYKANPRVMIDWANDIKPEDEPPCGYSDEKCSGSWAVSGAHGNRVKFSRTTLLIILIVTCIICILLQA